MKSLVPVLFIAAAAADSGNAGAYRDLVGVATAQISIAVILTALLCPVGVTPVDRWQRARSMVGTAEELRP